MTARISSHVLQGAVMRNFELLKELEKDAPAEVDRILLAMLAHIRSWKPHVLLTAAAPEVTRG